MQYRACAKVNIFLKIIGTRGNYHELLSRFMRVPTLYDTLFFVPKQSGALFELVGDFTCDLAQNTIYKMFKVLQKEGFDADVERVMKDFSLRVEKCIPTGAGLGGGSSDAATFLKMMNETAGLKLSKEDMTRLGSMVGADVAFFVSEYESANVSGIGEIVDYCDEKALDLEIVTPPLSCNTAVVYQTYREYFLQTMDQNSAYKMQTMSSEELLRTYDMNALNDLFAPCLKAYPTLSKFVEEDWFFSGSGSSFFRIKTVSKG